MSAVEAVVYAETMREVLSLMEKLDEWDQIAPEIRIFNRILLVDECSATIGYVSYEPFEQWVFIPYAGQPT